MTKLAEMIALAVASQIDALLRNDTPNPSSRVWHITVPARDEMDVRVTRITATVRLRRYNVAAVQEVTPWG
jgi:hypothetical protein